MRPDALGDDPGAANGGIDRGEVPIRRAVGLRWNPEVARNVKRHFVHLILITTPAV